MFTLGPWTCHKSKRPDNTGGYDYAVVDENHKIIAEVFEHVDFGRKKVYENRPVRANARLIAAAPDLYGALEAFLISEKQLRDAGWKVECDAALAVIKSAQS